MQSYIKKNLLLISGKMNVARFDCLDEHPTKPWHYSKRLCTNVQQTLHINIKGIA